MVLSMLAVFSWYLLFALTVFFLITLVINLAYKSSVDGIVVVMISLFITILLYSATHSELVP